VTTTVNSHFAVRKEVREEEQPFGKLVAVLRRSFVGVISLEEPHVRNKGSVISSIAFR
jgi:hypothetical protein